MKKILAIAIVAVMAIALCVSTAAVHAPEDTTKVWLNGEELNISWDTVYIDGKSQMDLGWGGDGAANAKVEANPITVGDSETITIRGWAGIKDGKTAQWGYRINEGAAVYGDFAKDTEDAVIAAGGDSRFEIVVPVKGLTAPTLITTVAKGEDGKEYDFIEFSVNGQYTGAEAPAETEAEAPATATVKAALSVDADKLYELFTTNVGANTVEAEKKDGYVAFTCGGEDPFFGFAEPLNPGVDAKYAVVKYRLTSEGERTIDFYLKIAEPHARAAVETDGEWHYVVVDLTVPYPDNMDTLWDGTIARLDPLSGNGITGTVIDIASIDFFTSEADAQAFADGTATAEQPKAEDPKPATNPKTADAAVIAIAAVACVALAGVVIAKKVK